MGKARLMEDSVLELASCLLLFFSFFSSSSCYLRKQPGYWLLSFTSGFSFCGFSFSFGSFFSKYNGCSFISSSRREDLVHKISVLHYSKSYV